MIEPGTKTKPRPRYTGGTPGLRPRGVTNAGLQGSRANNNVIGTGSRLKPIGGPGTIPTAPLGEGKYSTNYYMGFGEQDVPGGAPPGAPPGGFPTGNYGGGGGGGGGGGSAIDVNSILALMGRRPQQQTWQNLDLPDYQAREFYNFDPSRFDQARQGLDTGLAADLATGNTAYGEAATQLQNYQDPYAGRNVAQNPQVSEAMSRMLAANNVAPDAATQGQGVQADQAFNNTLALMSGAAQQQQASAARANTGDQRRFQESIAAEGRNMGLGIDLARARAREQYDRDKWQYGEDVARRNYETNIAEATANQQGQNQTNQANVAGNNAFDQGNVQALIQLISGGAAITPEMIQQFLGTGA